MKKKRITLEAREKRTGLLFVLPWVIGFLVFFAYNMAQTIVFSFNKLTMGKNGYNLSFVGLDNFNYAFLKSADFVRKLTESTGNILIDVPLIIFFSLFIAVILNRQFKGRALVRAIFFLPVIMASAAITSALTANLQNMLGGLSSTAAGTDSQQVSGLNIQSIAVMISDYGIPKQLIDFLVGAVGNLYEIIRNSGVQIIIFLAALQAIPGSLYEVAQMEGATGYEIFWKITFPLVSPLIVTNLVYTIVDLYSQSTIIDMEMTTAFTQQNFGLSAAMALVSSAVICLILGVCTSLISKKVFYQT
ncbi:MAG: sugar ABC transporter permease [Oscillospiraceae bacterium]|nr:sugar ABC transporter permease [Oscillospiraceae bacterium]